MYPKFAVLLLVLLLTWPASGQTDPVAGAQTPPPPPRSLDDVLDAVEQRVEEARQARRMGREPEAQAMLTDARHGLDVVLNAAPQHVHAQVLAGEIATEMGNHNEGRMHFKAVLEIEPSNFRANLGLGRFYVMSRLWRQAGAYLAKAERVAPPDKRSEALRLLALCYNGQGKRSEAVTAAERAVAIDPDDFESQQFLVSARLEARQYEEALEDAEALVATVRRQREQNPADLEVLQRLYRAYDIQRRALSLRHNSLYKLNARGEPTDEIRPGKEREAAEVLTRLSDATEQLTEIQQEFSYRDRLALVEKAVVYQPDNTGYLLELAGLLHATHQTERAVETCQRLLGIEHPTDTDPTEAERNKETARKFLVEQGAPLTAPPPTTEDAVQPSASAETQPAVSAETQPAARSDSQP